MSDTLATIHAVGWVITCAAWLFAWGRDEGHVDIGMVIGSALFAVLWPILWPLFFMSHVDKFVIWKRKARSGAADRSQGDE